MANLPLFHQDWWIDAVSPEAKWGVCRIESGGRALAQWPWVISKNWGWTSLRMPPLTPVMGPWIFQENIASVGVKRVETQRKLIEQLVEMLPPHDLLDHGFAPEITDWMPLYWMGFGQTTHYTLRLNDISDPQALWKNFSGRLRSHIRSCEQRGARVVQTEDIELFLELNRKVFTHQSRKMPYSEVIVKRIDEACRKNGARQIFVTLTDEDVPAAATYCVAGNGVAYNLMTGLDRELNLRGAQALALWGALQYWSDKVSVFDFEGSMMMPVEMFFRSFGCAQTPVMSVSHVNNRVLSKLLGVRAVLLDNS